TPKAISEKILNGERPPQKPVQGTPIEFQNIIEKSWNQTPENRPNMEKLYSHIESLDARYLVNKKKIDLICYNEEECTNNPNVPTKDLESSKVSLEKGIKYHQNKQYKKAWRIFEEYERESLDVEGKYWVGYYYLKGWHEGRKGVKGIPNLPAGVPF